MWRLKLFNLMMGVAFCGSLLMFIETLTFAWFVAAGSWLIALVCFMYCNHKRATEYNNLKCAIKCMDNTCDLCKFIRLNVPEIYTRADTQKFLDNLKVIIDIKHNNTPCLKRKTTENEL